MQNTLLIFFFFSILESKFISVQRACDVWYAMLCTVAVTHIICICVTKQSKLPAFKHLSLSSDTQIGPQLYL